MAALPGQQLRQASQELESEESEGDKEDAHKDGENRGGYDCEFAEPPPSAFQTECPICLQILKEPCLMSCSCGQKICRECIKQIKAAKKPCPLCNKSDNFTFLRDYGLERSLKEYDVFCANKKEGCEWRGKLGIYEQHLNRNPSPENKLGGCRFVEVECIHECGEWFQRCHITTHQTHECIKRPYSCDFCKDYDSTFEDVTETHYPQCRKHPIDCPKKCREYPFERQQLESHLKDECPLTLVDCLFHYAGCDVQLPRKDMPEHMKETATHLTLLASITHKLVKENLEYKEKLQATEDEVTKLKLSLTSCCGFPKVYHVKQTKDSIYLPSFYTHPYGYKMCVRVDPNGSCSGKGTHVSICTYLMKGLYDEHLKWPFRGNINIQIVNQAGDYDHVERIIHYNDMTSDNVANRVTSEERSNGWGIHIFIAHSDLEYNATKKTQYLKDNHLIVRVVKVKKS